MIKVYSLVTTLIIAIAPTLVYFLYTKPVEDLIHKQNEKLIEAKEEVKKAEQVSLNNKKLEKQLASLELTNKKQIKELEQKDKEIETLEWDFKKLFDNEEKLSGEIKKIQEINKEEVHQETSSNKINILKTIETDVLSHLAINNIWTSWVPYSPWAKLPDLKKLYNSTTNPKIKEIVSKTCPEEYYKEWVSKADTTIKALIRWYCSWNKLENCNELTKAKIEDIKSDTWSLSSVGHHFITKYQTWNPWNYTQRAFVYYDTANWKRICSWIWEKNWNIESFNRIN